MRTRLPILPLLTAVLVTALVMPAIANTSPALGAPERYSTGGVRPFGVTARAADLNGDGALDLAVTNEGSGTLAVMLNDGSGAFAVAQTLPLATPADLATSGDDTAASVGRGLAFADVDRDGDLDIVATDAGKAQRRRANPQPGNEPGDVPGWVLVYRNDGTGSFARLPAVAVGSRPLGVGITDLDGDGDVDVAIDLEDVDGAQILFGAGDGTFSIRQTISPITACASPHFPSVADFTGDGTADLLAPCNDNGPVLLFPGAGDGTVALGDPLNVGIVANKGSRVDVFQAASGQAGLARPHHLHVEDLNGDGRLDFAIANTGPPGERARISVFLGTAGTEFVEEPGSPYGATAVTGARTPFIVGADFAGPDSTAPDGLPDLLAASTGVGIDNHLVLLVNGGLGAVPQFVQAHGSPYAIGTSRLWQPAVGDFNGDGAADAAVLEQSGCADSTGCLVVLLHR